LIEAILILFGVFLYIFFFSLHVLRKRFWDSRPVFLLSLAYATLGTMSLIFNPLSVIEASGPLWAKAFSLFLIFLGWFIVGFMFLTGAITIYYKVTAAYYRMKAWFSNKQPTPTYHLIDHPTPTYSEQTYYPPPPTT
jgi:membrane-associated HD superfamily phosphohydrolase